ncbi:ORF6N domain-containing protein [bacterium]|nr:ORF6N domain-containing protein [bacterium]
MLDFDLAEIYRYSVKAFNQQAKNNIEKFNSDFMFQLNEAEFSAGSTEMDFSVNFSYGSVDQNVTSLTNYVRCVR